MVRVSSFILSASCAPGRLPDHSRPSVFLFSSCLNHRLYSTVTSPSLHRLQDLVLTFLLSILFIKFAIYSLLLLYCSFQIWTLNKYIKVSIWLVVEPANQQSSLSLSLACKKSYQTRRKANRHHRHHHR
ncbi:hypothetical protein B0F90DRAFT_228616 [Multifurca ochricompacta]|uniref:Uncharacterized protein n=1 Tax=Multifurca ochricompacta TaxID=376703 RepID=A0AAD4LYB2_9AGAM|nr:hypothetical protein B0F90DRAFT_228616 [Multifurca ochricompacta]